jgi:thiopurine S-methyltransferase
MNKEFWHQKWQSNEIAFNQHEANPLLVKYFPALNLKPGNRIFVPLCGKSVDMLWLVNQGYEVVGVELSSIACTDFFNEQALSFSITDSKVFTVFKSDKITLLSGDFFNLNKSMINHVDAIYDRAALIALPEELRKSYADFLIHIIKPGIPMLLISNTYNQKEMVGPPFSVGEQEVNALYGSHFTIQRLYHQITETIPAHLRAKGLTEASEEVYHLE